jgi:hypothetical protein
MEVLYTLQEEDIVLYIDEYIIKVRKIIRVFFPKRPKEMLKLCGGKLKVKIPKLL